MERELIDMTKQDICSMYINELEDYVNQHEWKKFRAKQIFEWIHKSHVRNASDMTNLPKDMREVLEEDMVHVTEEVSQKSEADGTIKFLYKMDDGQMIETVFMPYSYGNSICISSQAGCAMGCRFCASTIGGCIRDLRAGEMLGQVYETMRITGERISNVVVMGTGEPLENYDNLIRFIKLLTDEKGYNLSTRNITVSSCGIVPKIRQLAEEDLPITFALSLHSADDEKRKSLMPIANRYTIQETLDACSYFFEKTGRRVTVEYSLMTGINDSEKDAELLSKILKGRGFHVNLIPLNPVKERDYKKSNPERIAKFKKILEKNRINSTIRKGMGRDIDAACGQLRRKYEG